MQLRPTASRRLVPPLQPLVLRTDRGGDRNVRSRTRSFPTAVHAVAMELSSAGVMKDHAEGADQPTGLTLTDVNGEAVKYIRPISSSRIRKQADEMLIVGHSAIPEARDTLTIPVLGHKDWEEKRHQLLLQKMQLEVERERLQVRLAEQEERLQQSRLHSSRCSGKTREFPPSVVPLNASILVVKPFHPLSFLIRDQQADFSRSYSANGGVQMEASIQHQLPTRYMELEMIFNWPIKC